MITAPFSLGCLKIVTVQLLKALRHYSAKGASLLRNNSFEASFYGSKVYALQQVQIQAACRLNVPSQKTKMNPYFQRYRGCSAFRPWRCDIPRNSTAYKACSGSRGFCHGELEHVLPANKKTGSLNLNVASYNGSDAFFLRPYLTREEYAYWNSHLSRRPPSCACSCACASNPKDNTIVTYHHTEPTVCVQNVTHVQNATGLPCRTPAFNDGPVVCGKSTTKGFCRNTEFVPKPSVPEKIVSNAICGRVQANVPTGRYSKNASSNKRKAGECISKDKGFVRTPSTKERSIQHPHQTGSSSPNRSPDCRDSTKGRGAHQALSAESRRRISERYLCGDKSFEENPSARASPTRPENVKTGSTGLCDSTGTIVVRSNTESTASQPGKRKPTSVSEYEGGNCKKQCFGDDEHVITEVEAPNETIDLNDTLKSFLTVPLPKDNSHDKNESVSSDESRGMHKSRGVNRSRGMARTRVQGRYCAEKNINTISSDGQCEINNVKKDNFTPGSKTIARAQPKSALTDGLADVGEETQLWGQGPKRRK
ncbi:hypothetical protein ACROYT_G028247 [Oculina patagonica]